MNGSSQVSTNTSTDIERCSAVISEEEAEVEYIVCDRTSIRLVSIHLEQKTSYIKMGNYFSPASPPAADDASAGLLGCSRHPGDGTDGAR